MEKFHNASVFRGANISFLPNGGIILFSTGISGLTPSLAKLGFPVGYLQARPTQSPGVEVGVRVTGRFEDLRTQARLNSHKLTTASISKAFRYEDKVRNQ